MIFIVCILYYLVKVDQNEENNHQRTPQFKLHENGMCLQVMFSGPGVIKLFSCSTQLSTEFQLILALKDVSCFKMLYLSCL